MKLFASLTLVVVSAFSVIAQTEQPRSVPDFSGAWVLDKEESIFSFWRRGTEVDLADRKRYEGYTLVISQKGAELAIHQTYSYSGKEAEYKTVLFSDKRGEANIFPHKQYDFRASLDSQYAHEDFWWEDVSMQSKTWWEKATLVRQGTYQPKLRGNHILRQTYQLSKEGKTLTVLSDMTVLGGHPKAGMKSKLVFQKRDS